MAVHEPQPELRGDEPLLLETPVLRLRIGPSPAQGMSVAVRVDAEWRTIATAGWAQLVVVEGDSSPDAQRRTLNLVPSSLERADAGALTLAGALDDATLGHCHFDVDLEIVAERRIAMTYAVTLEHGCRLVHFRGPHLLFDQETLAAKDDALFPGLDWLLGPEESSATTNAAAALAVRSAPHPYKITVPLMALSAAGAAVGLWWDPLQLWCNAHAYPGALFALPEHDENAPARGRMALFVPTPASRWTAENQTHAHVPYNVPPGARVNVRATLYAGPAPRFAPSMDTRPTPPAHGALRVLDEWLDVQGSIPPPVLPRSPRAALDLCLHSYTAQCWDPETHGWHHTLADPWGPRYEAGIAAQLWQAARLSLVPDGERCRAIVRAGVEAGRQKSATQPVPHLDLAFSYGGLERALATTKAALGDLIARQRPDGAWPFVPTDERQRALGQEEDSSSGLTADATARLLRHARITGDRAAEQAGLRGMAFLRTQPRPEGAQTWELQVHVPDILAAGHGVAAAVEAYRLTRDEAFLAEGERWALAGLPFVYLWNPLFRPIMRYGSVPVFGASYFDAQAWFGVLVQWNGLVYARSLLDLATLRPGTRWRQVAEGIIACAVQQQMPDGPLAGMYPDAYSVVKGDEEYTWWLTPTLLGQALIALLGHPVEPYTLLARRPGGRRYHVTAADPLSDLSMADHAVDVTVHAADATACLLLAGPEAEAMEAVLVNGQALPHVPDLDAVAAGWRCPPGAGYVLIKPGQPGAVSVTCAEKMSS